MTQDITVIVPYTPGIPDRTAIWEYIKSRYGGFQIIETDDPIKSDIGFNKAAAIQAALPKVKNDIVIMSDADVWCDSLNLAITAVKDGASFAIPHKIIYRIRKPITEKLLNGDDVNINYKVRKQPVVKGGGLIVLRTEVIVTHPPDTRFIGWGGEDRAWFYELNTFYPGYWQGNGILYHMWHKFQNRCSDNVAANKLLSKSYKRCNKNKTKMTSLMLTDKPILK